MECSTMATRRGAMAGSSNSTANLVHFSSSSLNPVYHDGSHLQYYAGALKVYCEKKTKLEKPFAILSEKRMTKLLELVSMDRSALLITFSQSEDAEKPLVEQLRRRIFLDAVEVLMTQLEQEKAERKQRKKEKKLQTAQKKLQRKSEDSSSSSSECSDGECEEINMTNLCMNRIPEQVVSSDAMSARLLENPLNIGGLDREFAETKEFVKVQVCMGGKCKKLGSEQLLAAFEESIQISGMGCGVQAVGCKCMGKCTSAPNVRTQNEYSEELHLGVGMGDVDLVLDHRFGLKPENDELKDKILVQA